MSDFVLTKEDLTEKSQQDYETVTVSTSDHDSSYYKPPILFFDYPVSWDDLKQTIVHNEYLHELCTDNAFRYFIAEPQVSVL